LLTRVASDYLQAIHSKSTGFTYSHKLEKQAEASALKALKILDSHVRLPAQADGVTSALVVSSNGGAEYCITDPGTPDTSCNCSWAKRGNHCKHLMKVRIFTLQSVYKTSIYDPCITCEFPFLKCLLVWDELQRL
jgi:hypothetical protein